MNSMTTRMEQRTDEWQAILEAHPELRESIEAGRKVEQLRASSPVGDMTSSFEARASLVGSGPEGGGQFKITADRAFPRYS